MLFDVQSALAEILGARSATPATSATNVLNVANVAEVAAQRPEIHAPDEVVPFVAQLNDPAWRQNNSECFPHGVCALSGRPRTWTGKVVALDEWRRLSKWEQEGPAGRLFCGLCREWVERSGGCHESGCSSRDDAG